MANDAENIIDLYDRNAEAWDRERPRKLLERAWLERFLSLVAPAGSVLDIGCGSAEPIGRFVIDGGYAVTGIDAAPAMIKICKRRFPNASWFVADMRTLALGQRFDGLIAWDSFFHLSPQDQRRMFPLFRAHAAPDAALLFTSGPRHGEAIGSFHGEPLYHASLAAAEYGSLLNGNGFEVITTVAEDPSCGGHTVWLARMRWKV
jgi:SAM-dependent methyltransferase